MTNPYDRAEQRPASRLDPDPLHVPDDPTFDKPVIAIGVAWWVLASALVIAAIFAIAALLLAAPRAASETRPVHQVQPGASHRSGLAAMSDGSTGHTSLPSGEAETSGEPPKPSDAQQTVIGPPLTVVYGDVPDTATEVRGTATWCAPTPRHCQSWGGTAMLGAVQSFRYGDRPYPVRVCRVGTKRCSTVTVVSHCACGSTLIDLSPAAFRRLAPLSRGRIHVTMTRALPALPPTGTE